jgi:hypothetical protein
MLSSSYVVLGGGEREMQMEGGEGEKKQYRGKFIPLLIEQ